MVSMSPVTKWSWPVVGLGGAEEAVGPVGLHDGDDGPVLLPIRIGKEAGMRRTGDAAHPRLEEQMGGPLRPLLLQLLDGLSGPWWCSPA